MAYIRCSSSSRARNFVLSPCTFRERDTEPPAHHSCLHHTPSLLVFLYLRICQRLSVMSLWSRVLTDLTAAPAVPPPRPLISRASAHNLKADLLCGSHDSCRTCFRPAFACEVSSLPSLELQASARTGTPLPMLTSPVPYQEGCTSRVKWLEGVACGVT